MGAEHRVIQSEHVVRALDQLSAHWKRQGAPVAARTQPGLTDEAIDEIMAPTGLILRDEARLLFRWRNGTHPSVQSTDRQFGFGGWLFLPLQELVALHLDERPRWTDKINAENPLDVPDRGAARWAAAYRVIWPRYFPLFAGSRPGTQLRVAAPELAVLPPDWQCSLVLFDPEVRLDRSQSVLTLVAVLETWLLWLDAGVVRWEAGSGAWVRDDDALDATTYESAFG